MHYVPFVLKRGHRMTLKMLRPIAARHGLTPARFDILNTLLLRNFQPQVFPRQVAIANALGLCRSTVCKMVKALEKAGFLTQSIDYWDQRCRRIKLTPYGRRCLLRVLKAIRIRSIDRLLLGSLHGWASKRAPRQACLHAIAQNARRLSVELGDTADFSFYRTPSLHDRPPPSKARRAAMRRAINRILLSEASLRHYRGKPAEEDVA